MKDIEFPPLPDADVYTSTALIGYRYSYSAISMQSYARAAVEADRAQRVPGEKVHGPYETIDELFGALLAPTPAQPTPQQEPSEAEMVCAEAYQVVGCLLSDLGLFETEAARKILDNLSEARRVHQDVLPWESAAKHQEPPQQERNPMTDPCPGCTKGHVCRTPKCGRLALPVDHPLRCTTPGIRE